MNEVMSQIERFLRERHWLDLAPGDLAKSISIEAAELLEIFQWINPVAADVRADDLVLSRVKAELADVIIYALELCVHLRLDPEDIVRAKLEQAEKKYPAELITADRTSGEPANAAYHKAKRAAREHVAREGEKPDAQDR